MSDQILFAVMSLSMYRQNILFWLWWGQKFSLSGCEGSTPCSQWGIKACLHAGLLAEKAADKHSGWTKLLSWAESAASLRRCREPRSEKCFMPRLLKSEVRAVRQLFGNCDIFLKKKKNGGERFIFRCYLHGRFHHELKSQHAIRQAEVETLVAVTRGFWLLRVSLYQVKTPRTLV